MIAYSGGGAFVGNVVLTIGTTAYQANDPGIDTLGLTSGWYLSEFNIFADGNAAQASFNAGSSMIIYNSIGDTSMSDTCTNVSETGETNNLNLSATCATGHPPGDFPYITFSQSN